jgi:hypothetical protein
MAERSKDWPDATREPTPDEEPQPSATAVLHPTHEAMSFIRALANDWEDKRNHSQAAK